MFIALGFYCFVLGVECLLVEKVELTNRDESQGVFGRIESTVRGREIEPPDWAPWSLMSTARDDPLFFHHPEAPKEYSGRNHCRMSAIARHLGNFWFVSFFGLDDSSHFALPAAHCLLPTAYCLLPAAGFPLPPPPSRKSSKYVLAWSR